MGFVACGAPLQDYNEGVLFVGLTMIATGYKTSWSLRSSGKSERNLATGIGSISAT